VNLECGFRQNVFICKVLFLCMIEFIYDILVFKPSNKKELSRARFVKTFLLVSFFIFLVPTLFLILTSFFSVSFLPFIQNKFLFVHNDFNSVLRIFLYSLPFLVPLFLLYLGFRRRIREVLEENRW
jgi:hypothetical protein